MSETRVLSPRSPKRRCAVAAALGTALTTAGPALANLPSQSQCPQPSASDCVDPGFQTGPCYHYWNAYCGPSIQAAYNAQWQSTPGQGVLRMVPSGFQSETPDDLALTKTATPAPDSTAWGAPGSFVSYMMAIRYPPGPFYIDPRDSWYANGAQITSCQEYVYEKYFQYNSWEDQLPSFHGDVAAALDAIMAPGAVLYSGVNTSFSGWQSFGLYYPPPYGPRNAFFTQPDTRALRGVAPDHVLDTWLPTLAAGASVPQPSWEASRDRGLGALSSINMEYFRKAERMQSDYLVLLAERTSFYNRANACINNAEDKVMALPFADDPWCDQYITWTADTTGVSELLSYDATPLETHLVAIDQKILAALQEADSWGCLEPAGGWCDWRPKAFLDAVMSRVRSAEEDDFKRCMDHTQNDLSNNNSTFQATWRGAFEGVSTTLQPASDPVQLELWMNAMDQWIADQQFPVDPNTGQPYLGGSAPPDSVHLGNSMFGVTFGYDSGFSVDNYLVKNGKDYCDANVHVSGKVSASVHLLGSSDFEIVSATGSIATNGGTATASEDFRVLGNVVYAPVEQSNVNFDVALEQHDEQSFVSTGALIPILFVPVWVQAGVAGGVGYTGNLGMSAMSRNCRDGNGALLLPVENRSIGLHAKGTFSPYVNLDAWASASVDVYVFEAGVKGDLTLIRLGLPLTVDVAVAGTGEDVTIDATASLDLDVQALNGSVSWFLHAPWPAGDSEGTLVSWEGIHKTHNLFSSNLAHIPLSVGNMLGVP
jgi:hypothetical protein